MPNYILISAKARHGKDTMAQMLKDRLEQDNKKVYILHYADHLKEIAKTFYDWDGEKDEMGRSLLQALGDNKGKIKSNNKLYYVEHLITLIKYLLDKDDYVIIPDTRYPFEVDYVRDNLNPSDTLHTIRIHRIGFTSDLTEDQLRHESEIALDDYKKFDFYCDNFSLEGLERDARILCSRILRDTQEDIVNDWI